MYKDDNDGKKPPYDVGYGKPPVKNRFKKGESGNPSGRKACPPLDYQALVDRTLLAKVDVVTPSGRRKTMTKLEAGVESSLNTAIKSGSARKFKDVIGLFSQLEKSGLEKLILKREIKRTITVKFVDGKDKPIDELNRKKKPPKD